MRDRSRQQGLARPRRTVEEDALGLGDPERLEQFRVAEAELDDFLDLLDLLGQPADHIVRAIGNLLDHHEGHQGIHGGGEHLLQLVRIREQGDPFPNGEFGRVDGFGDVDDVFALRVDLDEYLFCAHHFHDLADVGARLLEQAEFLAEEPHARVVVVALGFEAAEFGLTLDDVEFHAFDLVMEEAVERHGGGTWGGRLGREEGQVEEEV